MAKSKAKARKAPPRHCDDNPAWTTADFARAQPAAKADPGLAAALKRGRGRPPLDKPKVALTLRIDQDAVEQFRATGAGWQTRMNDVLVAAAPKAKKARVPAR